MSVHHTQVWWPENYSIPWSPVVSRGQVSEYIIKPKSDSKEQWSFVVSRNLPWSPAGERVRPQTQIWWPDDCGPPWSVIFRGQVRECVVSRGPRDLPWTSE